MIRKTGHWVLMVGVLMAFVSAGVSGEENVSGPIYEGLKEAQKLMGEDRLDDAYDEIDGLREDLEADTIDQAVVLQMLGRVELSRENYPQAIQHLKVSHDTGKLPEQMHQQVGRMLAQLYASEEQYEQALEYARAWLESLEEPKPQQYMFLANLMAQTERYDGAMAMANRAIEASDDPRESWFQLLVASSFQQGDYRQTASDLKRMVRRWPEKPDYWKQLANIYVQLDDQDSGLAVLQLAWKSGVLEEEGSIRSMIQLAINRGIPERGARLLDHALEQGALPPEADYVELLANAWISAREYEDGIDSLERLASLRDSGDPYVRIANLHIERGRWQEAEASLRSAQESELEKPGEAWVLLGIALTEQEDFEGGFEALRKGRAYEDSRERAQRWIQYAQQLQKQHNWKQRNQSEGA